MGDSKRRQQVMGDPPDYNLAIILTDRTLTDSEIASAHPDYLIQLSIPAQQSKGFAVSPQTILATNTKAIAVAHLIVGLLTNPEDPSSISRVANEPILGDTWQEMTQALIEFAKSLKLFYVRLQDGWMDEAGKGLVFLTNDTAKATVSPYRVSDMDSVSAIAMGKRGRVA